MISRRQTRQSSIMAFAVGLLTAVGGFLYGYDTGIINGMLEMDYVKRNFAPNGKNFTAPDTAIITAVLSIGTFVGALFAPVLSDTIGRRLTIVYSAGIVFSLGTILQLILTNMALLCVGRFVSGLGVGIISAVIPLYQAESSPKGVRGAIISLYQCAITLGLLVSSAVVQGTHKIDDSRCFRIPISLQLIWSAVLSTGVFFLPESPRFFVKKDRLDDAIVALSRFRKLPVTDESLIEELIEIKASHDYEMSFGKPSIFDCFRSSPSRCRQGYRMFTGMALQALQQCTGINFIFYYGVNFFVHASVQNSYLISFITYAVNVTFTIPGIIFVEVIGRRKLIIFGAAGMTVSNFIIAIVGCTTDSVIANKVMIAFVCLFIAFFASSWGPVVWVIVGESYSLSVRQKAVSLTAATNWIVNFVFAYSTPYLVDAGKHTAALGTKIFFLWGACCTLACVFSYLFVYETKGLMLEEIDEMYRVCRSAGKSAGFKSTLHERYVLNNQEEQRTTVSSSTNDKRLESSSSTNDKRLELSRTVTTGLYERSHHGGNFQLNVVTGTPPSIDSNSDDDELMDVVDGHGVNAYNYTNEQDLMEFIQGLHLDNRFQFERSGDSEGPERPE
ncbi:unnamed protein product [Kuraishia capsulata CBS 1993]|uniref:Major facilitator superfamily (MFS) profile domain-containing protein n=1 Tax=Kuraishia capsulata CBS 1993 TaxID=1382522 RepID=W6MT62_9ASCO|nr:uncharacterized protein KUCA_T00005560001 [Kuraishia capsulata CBS 1993]CDK29568.1 unnamed protein product [Kuraishia capsulata CBS 1993]